MNQPRRRATFRIRNDESAASPPPNEPAGEPGTGIPMSDYQRVDAAPRHPTTTQARDIRKLLRGSIYSGLSPQPMREQHSASLVMEFALDLAEVMLGNGANSRETEVAVVAVTATWELAPLEMETTAAAVRLQYSPPGEAPITEMRIVREVTSNLTAVDRIYKLVDDIVHRRVGLEQARTRLSGIASAGQRWSSTTRLAATGILGFMLALLAGGDMTSGWVALLLATTITAISNRLARYAMPPFFLTVLQSALAITTGTVVLSLGYLTAAQTATTVAPLIVLLLPHPIIVACAQDAITGFREPANARVLSIVMTVLGVLLGLPAGLVVTQSWFHVQVDPSAIRLVPLTAPLAVLASSVAAAANAFGQGVAARMIPIVVALAGVTSVFQHVLTEAGFTGLFATFVASAGLGILCTLVAFPLRTAATVLAVPAFCGALLPSLSVAESLLNLVGQSPNAGLQVATALLSTLSIGAGLVLGTYLATPTVRRHAARRNADDMAHLHAGGATRVS